MISPQGFPVSCWFRGYAPEARGLDSTWHLAKTNSQFCLCHLHVLPHGISGYSTCANTYEGIERSCSHGHILDRYPTTVRDGTCFGTSEATTAFPAERAVAGCHEAAVHPWLEPSRPRRCHLRMAPAGLFPCHMWAEQSRQYLQSAGAILPLYCSPACWPVDSSALRVVRQCQIDCSPIELYRRSALADQS
eukprot:6174827-Pleurochrysis_carterae.AAC.2